MRFEHTRPNDSNGNQHKIIVIMYSVVSNFNMTIPFDRETISMQDVEFEAVIQPLREDGDKFGFIATQVQ